MIIRTEESRRLGAKYLDSADVGTQVECLHLCCETIDCDVFVFEGKVLFIISNVHDSIELKNDSIFVAFRNKVLVFYFIVVQRKISVVNSQNIQIIQVPCCQWIKKFPIQQQRQ